MNKKCTKCGQSKPCIEFAIDRSRPSGFQCWCRECQAASRKPSPRKRPKAPSRRLKRGRPTTFSRTFCRTEGTLEGLTVALLRETVWPQTVIAEVLRISTRTVSRIAHRHGFRNRYRVARTTLATVRELQLTKYLRNALIDRFNAQKGVFTAQDVKKSILTCRRVRDTQKDARRKLRHARLRGVKARRRIPRCTKSNKGLSRTELALLALMLQSTNPAPAAPEGSSRRVVS